jgi:hypothetical protein
MGVKNERRKRKDGKREMNRNNGKDGNNSF